MTLHPDAAAKIAEHQQRRTAWLRGEAPLVDSRFGPRTLGDLALLDVGCTAWARDHGPDMRLNPHGDPRGGIVLEIIDTRTVDNDTGELRTERAFRVHDPYRRCGDTLTEAQLQPDGCEMPDPLQLVRAVRWMAGEIHRGKGPITPLEAQHATDLARLAGLLMQKRGN